MLIRKKILLFVLSVITLSSILMTIVWYRAGNRMTERYLKDTSSFVMKSADEAFDYLLKDMSNLASVITLNEKNIVQPVYALNTRVIRSNNQWNSEYLKNSRMIRDFITELSGHNRHVAGITITAGKSCIFSTAFLFKDEAAVCRQIEEQDTDKLNGGLFMMKPMPVDYRRGTMNSGFVLPAVRGIPSMKGEIIGYCILYLNYDEIWNIFSASLPEGSFLRIVNKNGETIYSNREDEPDEGSFVFSGYSNPEVDWDFMVAVPSDIYRGELNRIMVRTAGIFLVIFVFTFLFLIIVIRTMTTEISQLKNTMVGLSSGDLSIRYDIRSKDEIGQMGSVFNQMADHLEELMGRIRDQEKKKRLIEMAFLEAQINPHFISNVLNNVIWMAKIQHADNIIPLIQSLNSLMQNVMHQEKDMVPLVDELEYVRNYLRIMEYSGNYDYEVVTDISPGTEKQLVLRFILQPIVENSIRHGLPPRLGNEGRILISAENRDDVLILSVEDNGEGMTEEMINALMNNEITQRNHFNGIGIPNVRERIRLFFGEPYGLYYESKKGEYTKAVIMLPVIKEGNE